MEELIWKYIDGQCNADELAQVELLIETDTSFRDQYRVLSKMDMHLNSTMSIEPSIKFKTQLEVQLMKSLAQEEKQVLFTPKLIAALVGCSALILLMGYFAYYVGGDDLQLNYIHIDSKISSMSAIVLVSFLALYLIDISYSKLKYQGKAGIFMA